MHTVFLDSAHADDERRRLLYDGQLFVHSPSSSALALVAHARQMIEAAFGDLDPVVAQASLPVEEYAQILVDLKPRFIHHPTSKEHVAGLIRDLGADPEKTYFDVPRMRTATSDGYLTSGIAYAFHPHRDTWYSAPMAQVNWWLPIYDVSPENVMAFHPRYWSQPVKNGSHDYNYYEWNRTSRAQAAQHVKSDTRKQPGPEEPIDLDPQVRVVAPVGGALLFSGAHLHSTVPNTSGRTRFSIDFRTVHIDDLRDGRGAPNLDSECTGTTLRDFLRASDLAPLPEDVVALYDDDTSRGGGLVFEPATSGGRST